MQHASAAPPALRWWKRENLVPGIALLMVAAFAWGYTLQLGSMQRMPMHGTAGPAADLLLFLFGWAVMMVAMMLPAALPLILIYRTIARKRLSPRHANAGMAALLAGYVATWTAAGLPVYGYHQLAAALGPAMAVLPGLLLITGGVHQFTALKEGCHARCSSPFLFIVHQWRPGVSGAARMGGLHGVDCLGCCAGLMLALVALGMMNVAWMLTAAVIIFAEKTLPSGHRVARPLGVVLVIGGLVVLGAPLLRSRMGM